MRYLVGLFCFSFLLITCGTPDVYKISHYYKKEIQDTILTNIIVNIYKVPRGVPKVDKYNSDYRELYLNQVDKFEFLHYFIDQEEVHYFYLIRPARNSGNLKRGVAGKYKVDKDYNLLEFEELYNTPMLETELIKSRGEELWADLMYFKNVDRYLLNKDYIEFPGDRVKYDKTLKEWVY